MIRRMEEADLEQIAGLETVCFSMPWPKRAFQDTVSREEYIYLVEEEAGRILGYGGLLVIGEEGDIVSIAVDPAYRKRKIGSRLLRELIRQGAARGVSAFTLEVRVSNAAAIHLYEKAGFTVAGIRPGYYESPRENAFIMWKRKDGEGTITT